MRLRVRPPDPQAASSPTSGLVRIAPSGRLTRAQRQFRSGRSSRFDRTRLCSEEHREFLAARSFPAQGGEPCAQQSSLQWRLWSASAPWPSWPRRRQRRTRARMTRSPSVSRASTGTRTPRSSPRLATRTPQAKSRSMSDLPQPRDGCGTFHSNSRRLRLLFGAGAPPSSVFISAVRSPGDAAPVRAPNPQTRTFPAGCQTFRSPRWSIPRKDGRRPCGRAPWSAQASRGPWGPG